MSMPTSNDDCSLVGVLRRRRLSSVPKPGLGEIPHDRISRPDAWLGAGSKIRGLGVARVPAAFSRNFGLAVRMPALGPQCTLLLSWFTLTLAAPA